MFVNRIKDSDGNFAQVAGRHASWGGGRGRPHEPRKNCQERWLRAGRRKPRETACGPLTNVREKKVWLRTPERESSCASPRQTPHRKTVTMIPAALYDVMRCKQASKIDFLKEPAYRMGKADCEEPNIQRRLSSLIGGIETGTVRARSGGCLPRCKASTNISMA